MKAILRMAPLGLALGCLGIFFLTDSGQRAFYEEEAMKISFGRTSNFRTLPSSAEEAKVRREKMLVLMREDPRAAIEASLNWDQYLSLPAEVRVHVEEPFSVQAVDHQIEMECGEVPELRAYVDDRLVEIYGRRKGDSFSRNRAALQGIRIGDVSVVREELVQRLSGAEALALEGYFANGNPNSRFDFMSGEVIDSAVVALYGERLFHFASEESLGEFEEKIAKLESLPGPNNGSAVFFEGLELWAASYEDANSFNWFSVEGIAESMARTWTGTARRAYVFTVSFPDLPSNPVLASDLVDKINGPISAVFQDMSFGKVHINAFPNNSAWVSNFPSTYYLGTTDEMGNAPGDGVKKIGAIGSEVIATLEAANPGFDFETEYDVIITHFPNLPGVKSAAAIGGSRMRLNGTTSSDTIVHELLHNLGMSHSSTWVSPDANPVNPAGMVNEYGHPFDVMANAKVPYSHLRAQGKVLFDWLETSQWTEVTTSGVHRVYPFDLPETDEGNAIRALKIPVNRPNDSLWVSYRRGHPGPESLRRGASVTWQKVETATAKAFLLDLKPGGSNFQDPGLVVGQTFSDGGVHLTTLAVGGISPNVWLDVKVVVGDDPGNASPSGMLTGPTVADARNPVTFTMDVTDADDSELAYHWDFGNGLVLENTRTMTHAFAVGRTYTVKCVASDMRGGTFEDSVTIVVADPLLNWTVRASQVTETLNDVAVNSDQTLIVACGDGGTLVSSPDGTTWTDRSLAAPVDFRGVCWSDFHQKWYASGVESGLGQIYSSPDGAIWTKVHDGGAALWGITCNPDGVIVATGFTGVVRRSEDGENFVLRRILVGHTFKTVSYGSGRFIAVADDGPEDYPLLFASDDGRNWTDISVNLHGLQRNDDISALRNLEDRFLVTGTNGTQVRFSLDDGEIFSSRVTEDRRNETSAPDAPRWNCPAMAYGKAIYFAAGVDTRDGEKDMNLVSLDGAHFHAFRVPNQKNRNAAGYIADTFVTVGDDGKIRQSDPLDPVPTSYSLWQQRNRVGMGEENSFFDDPDGDSHPNILEYALWCDPADEDSVPESRIRFIEFAGEFYPEAVVRMNAMREDLDYIFATSNDLETWEPLTPTNSVLTIAGGVFRYRSRQTEEQFQQLFLRVGVSEK